MNNSISVIVPVYKVEPYLDKCILSIVGQTYRNLEIILVDDGSPDNCPAMCDAWAERDSRIRVIHKKNGGVSSARNVGLRAVRGDWVIFVDSDDCISPRMIESLVIECNPGTKLVASCVSRFFDFPPAGRNSEISTETLKKVQLAQVRGGWYVWGILYDRNIIESAGLTFSEGLSNLEDVLWNALYMQYVDTYATVTNQAYYYRNTPGSITSNCVDVKWQVASWYKVRNEVCNWVALHDKTMQNANVLSWTFRMCQNNIHSECVAGNISYKQYRLMCRDTFATENIFAYPYVNAFERVAMRIFPRCYFCLYTCLIKAKRWMRKKKWNSL